MTMRGLNPTLVADLLFFVHAARLRSFSGAAKALNVTQGAVSQRIRRLERRLGQPLFVRNGTRITLTAPGRVLRDCATSAFEEIRAGVAQLAVQPAEQAIVLSCLPSLAIQWLVPRLGDFYALHPEARVEIRAEYSRLDGESMERDGIHVAVRYDREASDAEIEVARVVELVIPVCSPDYAARIQRQRKWCLLCDSSAWDEAAPTAEWDLWKHEQRQPWIATLETTRLYNFAHLTYEAAAKGQGVALGRSIIVHQYLKDARLVAVPEAQSREVAAYRVLARRSGDSPPLAAKLAQWIAEQLQSSGREAQTALAPVRKARRRGRSGQE